MKNPPVLIKKIYQKDNFTFTVDWSDGVSDDYRLSALQKQCSCALCYDPATGKQRNQIDQIDNDVRAVYIKSVGRYALRIQYTSGCSKGIYSFAMLRTCSKSSIG